MTKSYEVVLTADAVQDLNELYEYIAHHDAPAKAAYVLDKIEAVFASLETMPERGVWTKELVAVGMREYRETYFKPYRVIYRVLGKQVFVYVVADGRRDMATFLEKRFLRA